MLLHDCFYDCVYQFKIIKKILYENIAAEYCLNRAFPGRLVLGRGRGRPNPPSPLMLRKSYTDLEIQNIL